MIGHPSSILSGINQTKPNKRTHKTSATTSHAAKSELAGLWAAVSDCYVRRSDGSTFGLSTHVVVGHLSACQPLPLLRAVASLCSDCSILSSNPPILCPHSWCSAQPTLQSAKKPASQVILAPLLLVSCGKGVLGESEGAVGAKKN